ncbi:MAG: cytochrome P450 [Methylococcales bacterium]
MNNTAIPGPRGLKVLGILPGLYFDAIGTFRRMRARYGNLVEFPLPGHKGYLISDPELVQEVLHAEKSSYGKGQHTETMKETFGNGLLTADGGVWARQRKLLQPFFQKGYIGKWHHIVKEETERTLNEWTDKAKTGEHFDVCLSMRALIPRIMGRIMFGEKVPQSLSDRVVRSLTVINDNMFQQLFRRMILKGPLSFITTPGMQKFKRANAEYDKLIGTVLAMDSTSSDASLISLLRQAHHVDTGEVMSDQQLRDEVATFFFAGQETTINCLSWTLYYLALHSEINDRVADETNQVANGNSLTYEALDSLKFTKNVVYESLRLRSPVYAIERDPKSSSKQLDGCPIRPHSLVLLAQSVVHRHPDHWDQPERFNPDRFETGQQRLRHRFAFFPFGGGSRICIGMQLAMMEMMTFIATAAQSYQFELAQTKPVRDRIALTLRPRSGVFIRVRKRK